MNENNQNKVRFYLDQNVIDYLIKGKLSIVEEIINKTHNSEIIYSSVTLKEYARIDDESQRKLYIDYLKRVKAKYFWVDNNELAHFEDVDPSEKMDENQSFEKVFHENEDAMLGIMHKYLGGKKDVSFEELAIFQKNSFRHLMEQISIGLDSLNEHSSVYKDLLKKYSQNINADFEKLVDITTQNIKGTNYNTDNPLNDLRKLFNIQVNKLNEIKFPNIINQIWDKINDGIKNSSINLTYDDLFGNGFSRFFPNQKLTINMRINWLYNMLNNLGYYPDKNIRNDKKFIPFINDQRHVGNTIYSDFFITRDKRLMKKTEAIYEQLKIRTRIIFVE
jgi:hypothetical protein